MPITYDPDTNTITIVGTKDGQPYCFEDIWQADLNNGWGKFLKLSEGVYKTTAKLQFGDGITETLFEEKRTTLVCENLGTKDADVIIVFKAKCKAQFGVCRDVNGKKVVENGVDFQFRETTYNTCRVIHDLNSAVKYYACKFKLLKECKRVDIEGYIVDMIGCETETLLESLINTHLVNTLITGSSGHLSMPRDVIIDNVTIITTTDRALWISNVTLTVKRLVTITTDLFMYANRLQSPNVVKLINCKPHNWVVKWLLKENETSGELHRIYTVVFKVTDINGNPLSNRTVKVFDKNGDKIAEVTTDSNGLTPEIEILYAKLTNPYSDGQWHTFDEDDWEYFNPYTVEVWYGSELEYKGIITELDVDSTFIHITVKPSSLTLDDVVNKVEYVRKLIGNRWKIENNQLIIYDDDNETPIRVFDLFDKYGNPTEVNVYDRKPKT